MDISVIIPLLNEEESLPELMAWIDKVMTAHKFSHEVIMIDDGSTDKSWEIIANLKTKYQALKGLKFRRNYGKSAALNKGFEIAQGDVVITMDADLQDSPEEIPELYRMVQEENYDIVSGWKKKRFDPLSKTIPTKIYNGVSRILSGVKLHDMNCGLKAYRNIVVKNVEVYGEMHRYIPVIAKNNGFDKIGEKVVQHQARKFGETKFGLNRFIRGPLDLMSIVFVGKFGKRPMHFFGSLGIISILIGLGILTFLTIDKLIFGGTGMTDRPMFFLGILTLIVGTQLFATGFLAELVSLNAPNRNNYQIEQTIGVE